MTGRSRFVAMALAALLALGSGCAREPQEVKGRAATYTNPVFTGAEHGLREAPDPRAVKFNGEYYAYVTGDPCHVLKSQDLITWEYVGPMLPEPVSCWAPDVVYHSGIFYAYASTIEPGGGEGSRRVRLYTSRTPEGPFTYAATLTEDYSYDGHFFRDEDGAAYLYWTQICGALPGYTCRGNGTVVARMEGMTALAEAPRLVAEPEGWECRTRCILEAPAVQKRDGLYYLLYSGAAYENDTYGGGYARSDQPGGSGPQEEPVWTKLNRLLASVELKVSGPGGASWVKAPNNLDDWAIYHGRGFTRETMDRWLRIDPVMWGRDRLWIPGGPSYEPQPGPALPAFRDLFDREDGRGLGQGWTVRGGRWAVAGEEARQSEPEGTAMALIKGEPAAAYAFEANLRWLPDGAGGGAAGVIAYHADGRNQVRALLDRGDGSLRIEAVVGGKAQPTLRYPLPEGFRFDVYHQLLVRKNGPHFHIFVDGHPAADFSLELTAPGRAGLITEGAAAAFDGIAFAHGWEDFFDDSHDWGAAEDGTGPTGEWAVADSTLVQRAQGRIFKGSRWGSYAFTASLRPLEGSEARIGLYAAYADDRNHLTVWLDPSQGALVTQPVVGGKAGEETVTPIDIDFAAFHTVRIVKDGFAFRIWLDGRPVQERTAAIARGQPGLVTEGPAQYDSIRAVRWD